MANASTQTLQCKSVRSHWMLQDRIPPVTCFLSPEQTKGVAVNTQWKCGQVPPLGPAQEGETRKDTQLAYARTLLTVFNGAASQLAVVVDNLEQLHAEKEAVSSAGPPQAPAGEQTQDKAKLRKQASSSRMPSNDHV